MDLVEPMTYRELGLKAQSKKELYHLLSVDVGIYLPPIKEANAKYLSDVLSGAKKFVYSKNVKVIQIMRVKGLFVKDIIKFCRSNFDVESYLPIYKGGRAPDREWLANLGNTLIPDKFHKFIESKMKEREKYIIMNKSFHIQAIPEIISKIRSSAFVSMTKGKSHILMSRSTKRMKDVNGEVHPIYTRKDLEDENRKMDDEIKWLHHEIESLKKEQKDYEDNAIKLKKLYVDGIIDEDGNPL